MVNIKTLYAEFLSTLNELLGRDNKPKKAINATRLAVADKEDNFEQPLRVVIRANGPASLRMSDPSAFSISHVGGVLTFVRTKDVRGSLVLCLPQAPTQVDVRGCISAFLEDYSNSKEAFEEPITVLKRGKVWIYVHDNNTNVRQVRY